MKSELNIETFNRAIFQKVCKRKDYDLILRSIEHAVQIFGKGRVTSNIIIGIGRTTKTSWRECSI
jgi:biotin synthase-related radical SAM superfamily protein